MAVVHLVHPLVVVEAAAGNEMAAGVDVGMRVSSALGMLVVMALVAGAVAPVTVPVCSGVDVVVGAVLRCVGVGVVGNVLLMVVARAPAPAPGPAFVAVAVRAVPLAVAVFVAVIALPYEGSRFCAAVVVLPVVLVLL